MTITNKPIGGIPIADDAVSHIFQLLRPDEIEASKTIASHIRLVNQSSCYTALLLEYSLGVRPAQLPRWKLSEGDRVAKV
ncbi:hypothetical protein K0504_06315 [Neiella marina]|uniref:Uncharacterized protein n=1 Tax=Neiella holothuriorum TaxID=2870530 RepID=A0ABS7EE94_9GAMM|nr:hypothetical protein [Neiella holothuriorum]MBW8190647.1 hypothetical protein [Neiella holothuriorum]